MTEHQPVPFAEGFAFLESPCWHDGRLWVSDMWDYKVLRLDRRGARDVVCNVPGRPSGLGFLPNGTPLVVSMADRRLYTIHDSYLKLHADLSAVATGDLNEMLVDNDGRAYVGNFGYDLFAGAEPAKAALALVALDGTPQIVADELDFPNGSALIRDGKQLVIAESWSRRLTVFDRAADGSLSNRRLYADLAGRIPDGICTDREEGIWVASFATGEFIRVLPGGIVTDCVEFKDRKAVACTLGDEDGRTLFCITFAGGLDDIREGKRDAAIATVRVDVPGQV